MIFTRTFNSFFVTLDTQRQKCSYQSSHCADIIVENSRTECVSKCNIQHSIVIISINESQIHEKNSFIFIPDTQRQTCSYQNSHCAGIIVENSCISHTERISKLVIHSMYYSIVIISINELQIYGKIHSFLY